MAETLTREEYERRVMDEIAKAADAGKAIAELNAQCEGGVPPQLSDPKCNRIAQILAGMATAEESGGGGEPNPRPAPKPEDQRGV